MPRVPKYQPEKLVAMFRLAAELRGQMIAVGFTDNGGAIHSAERILHLLGLRLCYPGLSHVNNLRNHPGAPISQAALLANQAVARVLIEHVNPHRALTRLAIAEIKSGADDAAFFRFVLENYRLALLTVEETTRLNKQNRSKIEPDRLAQAGIELVLYGAVPGNGESTGSAQSAA